MNVNDGIYNVQNNTPYSSYPANTKAADTKAVSSDDPGKKTDSLVYNNGSEPVSKTYTANGTLAGTKTGTSKSWCSAKEIIDEIDRYISSGQFYAIWNNGKETWLQGINNGEPVGGKKYFDPDELNALFGKGNEKTVSIGNNAVSFDKYSYYKFTGKDGKEHTIMSLGNSLGTGITGDYSYDKEAADYINFWNSLARQTPSGIYLKFSNEEIRSRLAEAGIQNGFFTVTIGGRSVTHFLSQGKNASAVHSKEQYDDRYNSIISGRAFHNYEPGQKVMIGGKEYILDENKKIDIEYGEDLYDIQIVNSNYNESTEFSYDDATRQKAEAIIDEWQEQIADIKEGKNPVQSAREQEDQNEQEEESGDQSGSSGKVGINAGKLARMLASAKTRSQVQAVIAKIQSDLDECEAGKKNGMDVDEASVKAAQQLLQQANSLMGSAENREATPEEEMAAMLAALM